MTVGRVEVIGFVGGLSFGGCGSCSGSAWAWGGFAGVEVVPVDDGVEAEGEGALGLPAPEGA